VGGSWWQDAGWNALETIFPGRCLQCGEWLATGDPAPVCRDCAEALTLLRDPRCRRCGIGLISEKYTCLRCRNADFSFDSNVSLFSYGGTAKRLVAEMKFAGRTRLAPFFAERVSQALKERCLDKSVVVPAPPRRGRRTPDAVALVARALEGKHGIRVLHVLQREGAVQQKSLDYEQRKANLKGKISLSRSARCSVMRGEVVLLDDVFTTGATLDACARVLREAGCTSVKAFTLVIEE
jgi:ComF family protein